MNTTTLGSTNADQPFQPGETIDYCDEHYVVEANYGNSGTVRELHGTSRISPFYWTFDGAACRRVVAAAAAA
jgi:hypothetical protein